MSDQIVVTTFDANDRAFTRAVRDVAAGIEREFGVRLDDLGTEHLTSTVRRHAWMDPSESLILYAIDDLVADARYVEVLARTEQLERDVLALVRANLPKRSLAATLAELEATPRSPALVNVLGLLGPTDADDRLVDLLATAMRDRDPAMRAAAANAAGLLSWPELAEPLAGLARREPVDDVRAMARRALLVCMPER